jgi:hypothetical protein
LSEPDDVSVGFIELLDQVIFEIEEVQNANDNKIEEYLIEDLYQRVESYLEVLSDADLYKRNLGKRIMNVEDTIIIKRFGFVEYVPLLMSEFNEQAAIRQHILKALISFNNEELLQFYYDILKKECEADIKVLSLIGLKKPVYQFDNWHLLECREEDYGALIQFVQSFKYENPAGSC